MSAHVRGARRSSVSARQSADVAVQPAKVWAHRLIVALLIVSGVLSVGYVGVSTYIATVLSYAAPIPVVGSPSQYGLTYADITFPARGDGLTLKGWFIPGVRPDGSLTTDRAIIMVHGTQRNRADDGVGLLALEAAIAKSGFAVLVYDMRGEGESEPAPLSLGYFEQRDVLGAVDFLQRGPNPYPELGRPRIIGGWGVSMGGATLILATAQEPAIRAIVSDSAYAEIVPITQREIPLRGHVPGIFTPGALAGVQLLYGMDLYAVRPKDVIASIAPRPIFLIQGTGDTFVPFANLNILATAARSAPSAQVQTWETPGVAHAQSYHFEGQLYVDKVVAFFNASLGPDQSAR